MELKKERMEYNLAQSWIKSMQKYIMFKYKNEESLMNKCLESLKEIYLIDKYGTHYNWNLDLMDFCIEETDGINSVTHTFKNLCDTGNKDISERVTLYYFDLVDLADISNNINKTASSEKITKINYIDVLKDIEATIENNFNEDESEGLYHLVYKIRDDEGRTWIYDEDADTFCMKDTSIPGKVYIEDEYTQMGLIKLDVEVVEKTIRLDTTFKDERDKKQAEGRQINKKYILDFISGIEESLHDAQSDLSCIKKLVEEID